MATATGKKPEISEVVLTLTGEEAKALGYTLGMVAGDDFTRGPVGHLAKIWGALDMAGVEYDDLRAAWSRPKLEFEDKSPGRKDPECGLSGCTSPACNPDSTYKNYNRF